MHPSLLEQHTLEVRYTFQTIAWEKMQREGLPTTGVTTNRWRWMEGTLIRGYDPCMSNTMVIRFTTRSVLKWIAYGTLESSIEINRYRKELYRSPLTQGLRHTTRRTWTRITIGRNKTTFTIFALFWLARRHFDRKHRYSSKCSMGLKPPLKSIMH